MKSSSKANDFNGKVYQTWNCPNKPNNSIGNIPKCRTLSKRTKKCSVPIQTEGMMKYRRAIQVFFSLSCVSLLTGTNDSGRVGNRMGIESIMGLPPVVRNDSSVSWCYRWSSTTFVSLSVSFVRSWGAAVVSTLMQSSKSCSSWTVVATEWVSSSVFSFPCRRRPLGAVVWLLVERPLSQQSRSRNLHAWCVQITITIKRFHTRIIIQILIQSANPSLEESSNHLPSFSISSSSMLLLRIRSTSSIPDAEGQA